MDYADDTLEKQLASECLCMASWALRRGIKLPNHVASHLGLVERSYEDTNLDLPTMDVLAGVHGNLAALVSPALPGTIRLLEKEAAQASVWKLFGPVSMVRRLMFMAALSLLAFILLAASSFVDGDPASYSLFESDGLELLLNQAFLLSAASIGACFFALHQASGFLKSGTYNPRFESMYWIRYGLGLMSGIILATIIPVDEFLDPQTAGTAGDAAEGALAQGGSALQGFGKPLIALLGGFSASVVYRILTRLVAAVETVVRADAQERITSAEEAMKVRLAEQNLAGRAKLVGGVTRLMQTIGEETDPADVRAELEKLQLTLLPSLAGDMTLPDPVKVEAAMTEHALKSKRAKAAEGAQATAASAG